MTRAQPSPVEPLDLADNHAYKPVKRDKIAKLLLRFSPWLKPLISEAADREGISMNTWCVRVLAEAAKASRHGFISQPVDIDTDRMHPVEPEPYTPFPTTPGIVPPSPWTTPPYTPTWKGGGVISVSGTGTSTSTTTTSANPNANVVSVQLHNIDGTVTDITDQVESVVGPSFDSFEYPDNDIPELT